MPAPDDIFTNYGTNNWRAKAIVRFEEHHERRPGVSAGKRATKSRKARRAWHRYLRAMSR